MKQLDVFLNDSLVGTLTMDRSGLLSFAYADEWLAAGDVRPLSRSLPLRRDPFTGKEARFFFAGILPDEGIRQQVAAIIGISERNDFALLEHLGGECAGAVSLLPAGTKPAASRSEVRFLSDEQLYQIAASLPLRPLLAGEAGLRLSLAGSQTKLPVIIYDNKIALPLGNSPSTHIIKPEPKRFPRLVANEYFCMRLGAAIGLAVPSVTWRLIEDLPCLIIERYDRTHYSTDQKVIRIHQEDFCQALGYPPERKYQEEGGPMLRDCFRLLRDWSTLPALDLLTLLDVVIFNMLIGNADAHGKNYSLLYRDGQRRLAPFYDLVSTLTWPELSSRPAMKIGKAASIELITLKDWQLMAAECGLGWPMVRERIHLVCDRVLQIMTDGKLQETCGDQKTVEQIVAGIQARAARWRDRG